jgi:poly(3-hydroxyalkanoate) synthetase
MPVLNVYATADHLVPPSASLALAGRVGSDDYTEYAFRGGHIGIYVSSRARKVPAEIVEWIAARAHDPAREETSLGKGGKKRDGKKRKKKGAKGGKKAKRKAGKAAS